MVVDDVTDITSQVYDGEVTFTNVFPIDKMRQGGTEYLATRRYGDRPITGKLSLYFDTVDMRNKFLAEEQIKLQFAWLLGSKHLKIVLTNCKFLRDVSGHVAPIDQPILLNAPFQAFYDDTYNKEGYIQLKNEVVSY